MLRRIGSRPTRRRSSRDRVGGVGAGILVVGLEVEPRIKARHLIGVAIEHERRPPLYEQAALTNAALGGLAPARVVDVGIDVGIKPVLARVLNVPGARGLFFGEADPNDRLHALEA